MKRSTRAAQPGSRSMQCVEARRSQPPHCGRQPHAHTSLLLTGAHGGMSAPPGSWALRSILAASPHTLPVGPGTGLTPWPRHGAAKRALTKAAVARAAGWNAATSRARVSSRLMASAGSPCTRTHRLVCRPAPDVCRATRPQPWSRREAGRAARLACCFSRCAHCAAAVRCSVHRRGELAGQDAKAGQARAPVDDVQPAVVTPVDAAYAEVKLWAALHAGTPSSLYTRAQKPHTSQARQAASCSTLNSELLRPSMTESAGVPSTCAAHVQACVQPGHARACSRPLTRHSAALTCAAAPAPHKPLPLGAPRLGS